MRQIWSKLKIYSMNIDLPHRIKSYLCNFVWDSFIKLIRIYRKVDPVWKSECISLHIQQKREHRENADDAHIPMKGPYSMVQRIVIPSHGLFSKFSYIKHHKCEEFAEPNCKSRPYYFPLHFGWTTRISLLNLLCLCLPLLYLITHAKYCAPFFSQCSNIFFTHYNGSLWRMLENVALSMLCE